MSIVVTSALFLYMELSNPSNPLITDICGKVIDYTPEDTVVINKMYAYITNSNNLSFQLITSVLVCLYSLIMIVMLQNTQQLGELIMMVSQMINELQKFLITFGMVIIIFIIVGRQLNSEFKNEESSIFQIVLDIFDGLNGKQRFDDYQNPQGKLFITVFVYVFNILLLSFLVAMFINRYKYVWQNIDAIRRMEIIKLKNSNSYDSLYGGVTLTFFPISVIVLPFVIPVVVFKSERLNDFILKI